MKFAIKEDPMMPFAVTVVASEFSGLAMYAACAHAATVHLPSNALARYTLEGARYGTIEETKRMLTEHLTGAHRETFRLQDPTCQPKMVSFQTAADLKRAAEQEDAALVDLVVELLREGRHSHLVETLTLRQVIADRILAELPEDNPYRQLVQARVLA